MAYAAADVRFTDAKLGVDTSRTVAFMAPVTDGPVPVDWTAAERVELMPDALQREASEGASYALLPGPATKAKNYTVWNKQFSVWLSANETVSLLKSPATGEVSNPDESERDFRAHLHHAGREARDGAVDALRKKYGPKRAALDEKLRRAKQSLEKESEQATGAQLQTAISVGATLVGALFGRKAISASTIGRATTAARGVGRAMKESEDIGRARDTVAAIESQIEALDNELAADTAELESSSDAVTEKLDAVSLKAKRGGVAVKVVALVWR